MSDDFITVKIHSGNVSVRTKLQEITQKIEGFQVRKDGDTKEPEILVYELGNNYENDFRIIESLLNSSYAGDIFLTYRQADPEVLLRSLRLGAKEFFPQPINEKEVISSFERFKNKRKERDLEKSPSASGNIVHVLGSKGGVGTTTVAVNLATALCEKKSDYSVILVDMNMVFGDVAVFLGLTPKHHWGELAESIDRLDNTFLRSMLTLHRSGVRVLTPPTHLNGDKPFTPDYLRKVINILRAEFDVIIVDGGQSLNALSRQTIESADHVLMVSLLSLTCLSNAKNIIKSFNRTGTDAAERTRIVINRFLKKSLLSLKDAEEAIGKKPFWTIPNDYQTTMAAINEGKPLSEFASKAPVTKSIADLAHAVVGNSAEQKKRSWSLFRRK